MRPMTSITPATVIEMRWLVFLVALSQVSPAMAYDPCRSARQSMHTAMREVAKLQAATQHPQMLNHLSTAGNDPGLAARVNTALATANRAVTDRTTNYNACQSTAAALPLPPGVPESQRPKPP
jgi:hypothetical protein